MYLMTGGFAASECSLYPRSQELAVQMDFARQNTRLLLQTDCRRAGRSHLIKANLPANSSSKIKLLAIARGPCWSVPRWRLGGGCSPRSCETLRAAQGALGLAGAVGALLPRCAAPGPLLSASLVAMAGGSWHRDNLGSLVLEGHSCPGAASLPRAASRLRPTAPRCRVVPGAAGSLY